MSAPFRFLNALARVFSALSLYGEGHPAREQALEEVYQGLLGLLDEDRHPTFTFLEGDVVYGKRSLREFRDWPLGKRLLEIEVQRFEFMPGASRQEVSGFLNELAARFIAGRSTSPDEPVVYPHIKFGPIDEEEEEPGATFNLGEQTEKVDSIHDEATKKGRIPIELASSVVETLSMAMRAESSLLVPLVPLKETDEYSTVHSINTSVIAMALGEYLRLTGHEVRLLGQAGLLHDVGKVIIPKDIINKPTTLDPDEWEVVKLHTSEGAKIILQSGEGLDMAAMAAYEHHLKWKGEGGYPNLNWPRRPHRISQLIHLCDGYDAMRTKRPFQNPMPTEEILLILLKGAGVDFEPGLIKNFIHMMHKWASRIVIADGEETV